MDLARANSMVHPGAAGTQAVRATLFVDPRRILRAMAHHPKSNSRFIAGFARLLQAMQTSDQHAIARPEGWTPGCDLIVPPLKTAEGLAGCASEGYKMVQWHHGHQVALKRQQARIGASAAAGLGDLLEIRQKICERVGFLDTNWGMRKIGFNHHRQRDLT
jgi:hypothetical protein